MRIVISGYYGFGNSGDEALLAGLLAGLLEHGHEPLVLSAEPRETERLHGVEALHRLRGVPAALLRANALVSGGGGLLQDQTSSRSLDYYLSLLSLARSLGRKAIVYGQSMGPLSGRGERRVARVLRGVPTAVRDRASQRLLSRLGLQSVLVADPALLLGRKATAAPRAAAPDSHSAAAQPPAAGSSTGSLLLIPRGGHPKLTETLLQAGRHFAALGRPVAVGALHPREDGPEAERLAAGLGLESHGEARDGEGALDLIASHGTIVSVRLHGLILAAATGRPFVGLPYDPKVAAFLQESGRPVLVQPIGREDLLDAIASARPLPDAVRRELRTRARKGIDWLSARLQPGG